MSKTLELSVPAISDKLNSTNRCFNTDANELVKKIKSDVIYLDPPYNSRQYCDAYHLLENIASWQKPEVKGIARKMSRTTLKSRYCTKSATLAFEDLINNIDSKYILVSYNDTGKRANDRSNARLSDAEIISILQKRGKVKVFSRDYKLFTTGKSLINNNKERLFLCKVKT